MERMMSQINLSNDQPPGPLPPPSSHTHQAPGGLTEGIRKKPPKSIILEPPPPLPLLFPEQESSTASTSTSTSTRGVRRKNPNLMPISDEDLAKQVATSIKRIIQRSLNVEFRQKCFQLMNVTNSEDAEVFLRNKLRTTIGLPEEIHETTMEQRMQASLARRVAKLNALQHIPLSSSVASMLSQRELESITPNNLAVQSQSQRPESQTQSQSLLSQIQETTMEQQMMQSSLAHRVVRLNGSQHIPLSNSVSSMLSQRESESIIPNNLALQSQSQKSESQSLLPPPTSSNPSTQSQGNSVQIEDVSSSDPMDTSMAHVAEIRISGNMHLNEHGIPTSSANSSANSSQRNSQLPPGGKKEILLQTMKILDAKKKAEKKKAKRAKAKAKE